MGVWTIKPSKGNGGDYEKPPAGNHPAVLVAIVDMGTQESEYQGEKKEAHRAYFVWELVTCKQQSKKDVNHVIGIDLTLSLNEKAKLRHWIEARTGKPIPEVEFDIASELGKPCLLNVKMTTSGYPKIGEVTAVPTGFNIPAPQNTPFSWNLSQLKATGKIDLPDFLPYFYGKPIAEQILQCSEVVNGDMEAPKEEAPRRNTLASNTLAPPAEEAPPNAPNGAPPSPPPPPSTSTDTYWLQATKDAKPSLEDECEIVAKAKAGKIDVNTAFVVKKGEKDWKLLSSVLPMLREAPF